MDNRFVIYVRKSSEQEERQILSIEAQLRELEEYAAKEQLPARMTPGRTGKSSPPSRSPEQHAKPAEPRSEKCWD